MIKKSEIYKWFKDRFSVWHIIILCLIGGCVLTPSYIEGFYVFNIKIYYSCFIFGLCILAASILLMSGNLPDIKFIELAYIISLVSGVEACFMIINYIFTDHILIYRKHFDNVAGEIACLCPSFPYILYLAQSNNKSGWIGKIIVLIILSAIIMSYSRTGILCVIVTVLFFFGCHNNKKHKMQLYCFLLLLPLVAILYLLRPESANGRMLIYKILISNILDVPITGYGIHGFREKYMAFQAEYFRNNCGSSYSMLADNVLFPFNEYLHLYMCFGFLGLLTLLLMGILLYKGYCQYSGNVKFIVLTSIMSICLIGLFSYPFSYPYVYLIIIIGYGILFKNHIKAKVKRVIVSFSPLFLITIGVVTINYSYGYIHAVRQWRNAYEEHNLSLYLKANETLKANPYFLYNYSSILFDLGFITESYEVAMSCKQLMVSYNLELLLGEINQKKGDYLLAEKHFNNAKYMCPCRFMPLYLLMRLYCECGEKDREISMALEIIEKPIKVKSIEVSKIRLRAKSIIEKCLE